MTFALHAGGRVVTAGSALLKARDREAFDDSLSLLEEARVVRDAAQAEADRARAAAVAEGREAGLALIRGHLATAVAELGARIDDELMVRRADIADAALAATRAIVGSFDEAEVTARIAVRAIDRIGTDDEVVITVAPTMVEAVRDKLSDRASVTVRADPQAAPLDCVLHTGSGRIIASLSLQLDALAARWGVAK